LQQICSAAENKFAVLHAAYLQCCNPVLQSGANFTQVEKSHKNSIQY
jgi:predicted  nucleic acid-binding Zn ribbon protein